MTYRLSVNVTVLLIVSATGLAAGPREEGAQKPRAATLTVAVLDFGTADGQEELGRQVGETLSIVLSDQPGVTLVERAALERVLQETELSLSGVVKPTEAVKVGKLVGARIMITGRLFAMGNQLFATAKMIGTETSLVEGVMVKGPLEKDVGKLVLELASKVSTTLHEKGASLVARDDVLDPLPKLKQRLSKLRRPRVGVLITEEHIVPRPAQPPDPAVETEIKRMLIECGFEVQDVGDNQLVDKTDLLDDAAAWPHSLSGVDYIVIGEAFSEPGGRIGNLQCCVARAEINLIHRGEGKILLADRARARGVDLAQHVAGKRALQSAGRTLGLRLLEHLAGSLPKSGKS